MRADRSYCELPTAFVPCEFKVKWAHAAWELQQALALRCAVFCDEQRVFEGDDIDTIDPTAQTVVALSRVAVMDDQVAGTVRIHRAEPGLWWGSRLAVQRGFRKHAHLATTLIRLAVSSAHARGCKIFLAHVQSQNVPLFEHLQWRALRAEQLHGRPHMLMQADLGVYPPCYDPYTGFVTRSVSHT